MIDSLKALDDATAATERARQHVETLRARIREAEQARKAAEEGPYPPDELAEAMRTWFHRYLAEIRRDLAALPHTLSRRGPRIPEHRHADFLVLALADVIEAELPRLAARLEYTPGPPRAARKTLAAAATTELEALRAEEEQLVDALLARGVRIDHRPDVVQRRREDAYELDRLRRARERDEAEQRAIDAAHAERRATRRVGRSEYLASGGTLQ